MKRKDIKYMINNWTQEEIDCFDYENKDLPTLEWKQNLKKKELELINEIFEEDSSWAVASRLEYLEDQLAEKISKLMFWFGQVGLYGGWFAKSILEMTCKPLRIECEKILKEIKVLKTPIQEEEWKPKKKGIDNDDIASAKEVPMDSLITFNRAGFATCIFHNEKHASLKFWSKHNVVHCFGCNKTADTIDVVRKIYDYSFKEAEGYLNRF